MARIDVLPSIEIIRGLKGVLDFYIWRGLACVRAWPRYRPSKQTDASLAAALLFGAIVKAYNQMGEIALQAYRDDALDQPRTARDLYVTSQYGNLHEASMSDFLDALIVIRDATVALTDLLHALHSDGSDRMDVDVHASVLPPLAATTTNQGLIYTRLGTIDDLVDALESNALDRLLVRGMDQLFSLNDAVQRRDTAVISGAGGFIDSSSPAAGNYWIITTVLAWDGTSPTTRMNFRTVHGATNANFHEEIRAFAAADQSQWSGQVILEPTDVIRVHFAAALLGDTCSVCINGFQMTRET